MYEVTSENASKARSILEETIAKGRRSALGLIERLHTNVPTDTIVEGGKLKFDHDLHGRIIVDTNVTGKARELLHEHALTQACGRAGIPYAYVKALLAPDGSSLTGTLRTAPTWKQSLAADILQEHYRNGLAASRFLLRSVQGEVRAVLSDRFRRLDSRQLADAFCASAEAVKAVPVEGHFSDTRVAMKALMPTVYEPIPNEVLCIGVEWGNSDFGAAKHTIRAFIMRLWCLNGATMSNALAQVHVGRQLESDLLLSQRTYDYDTKTSASALDDVIRGTLSENKVEALLTGIKAAHEKGIEWKNVKGSLAKKLLKHELEDVERAFESNDTHNLPEGKTTWRMSNAISWIAGHEKDENRKLELQRLAGEILDGKRDKE